MIQSATPKGMSFLRMIFIMAASFFLPLSSLL